MNDQTARRCITTKRLCRVLFVVIDVFDIRLSFFFCLSVFQSKRKFERECKEAEKSQITFDRLDNDINATKSEVEKVGRSHLFKGTAVNESVCEPASPFFYCQGKYQFVHFDPSVCT